MKIKSFKEKMPILFCVVVAVIVLVEFKIAGQFLSSFIGNFFTESTDYFFVLFIGEFVAAIFVLLVAYLCGNLYTLKRQGVGLRRGFAIGGYPTVLFLLLAALSLASEAFMGTEMLSRVHIMAYLGTMFLVGFVEELIFRGVIAETLIQHFGTTRGGIWAATAISGVIFGSAHIFNIVEVELLGVFVQIAVASVLGMLLAAIYYRSGNLWVCILIHAGLDAASLISSGVFAQGTIEEFVSSYSLLNLMPCITYFIPVLVLLRVTKLGDIERWFGDGLNL
ncbi:MAG: CPBP family intramembrane glutamic endopeptidase [Eubacteriales bacterium]